jgi:hypothetical protein
MIYRRRGSGMKFLLIVSFLVVLLGGVVARADVVDDWLSGTLEGGGVWDGLFSIGSLLFAGLLVFRLGSPSSRSSLQD